MARMCDVMTLACATVLAAGSVASADNKAALAAQPTVDRPTTPLTATAMWPHAPAQSGGGAARALPGCAECPDGWFNGDVDGRYNGQASHLGGGFPYGERAADDFHLCPGFVYDVSKICGTLITNSNPYFYRARLQIFSDCNGCPDELLYQFDLNDANPTVTTTPLGAGIVAVDYCFTVDDSQPVAANRSIVLRGKCYWVSIQGISDGQGSDVSFFAATGWDDNGTPDPEDDTTIVKGHQAKKDSGASSVPGHPFIFNGNWEDLDACCIGCTDLAFSVCVEPCKILIDNGFASDQYSPGGRSGERSERSAASNRNSRAADDFAVGTCTDFTLCYIEGCVYTNCRAPFSGFYEIYGNDCKFPDHLLRDCPGPEDDSEPVVDSGSATKIVPLGFSITQDGITLQAYRLEFHDLSTVLPKARQYWISLGIDDTYSLTERALFCYNDNCPRECLVRFNPGAVTAPTLNCWETVTTNKWTSTAEILGDEIGRDFSFLIAGNYLVAGGSGSTCAADFNGDNQATVQDLFDFLSAWFTGCP